MQPFNWQGREDSDWSYSTLQLKLEQEVERRKSQHHRPHKCLAATVGRRPAVDGWPLGSPCTPWLLLMRCMAVQRDSYRSVWHMGICAPSTSMSATPCVSDIMWSSGTGTRRPVETGREQTSEDVVLGKKKKKKKMRGGVWGERPSRELTSNSDLVSLSQNKYLINGRAWGQAWIQAEIYQQH